MPVFVLDSQRLYFPPAYLANEEGILAIGGDLRPERLLLAYQNGIFPWFNDNMPPLWWSPNPRFVLYPSKIKVSKSMKQLLKQKKFRVTFNQAFEQVMRGCQQTPRKNGNGTWISDELIESFCVLHYRGVAHSVEVWQGSELVGGLYGIIIGKYFSGESMFTRVSNASKYGFIIWTQNLQRHGFEIIDCQTYTDHLASLGAEMISRLEFLEILRRNQQTDFYSNLEMVASFQPYYSFEGL
ncbi:MAG: leucyl/phenylalanyl-tRNA--protein transferase [Cytophagales bacterium]|nr:leucyl/phenylalanyl-tRNA--protein transferase [Cytophagales bacterium]MDW8384980.1 leucyl/phenylalanyl-tRNA--protein transferase [Flammeovirgaceae bacterium]